MKKTKQNKTPTNKKTETRIMCKCSWGDWVAACFQAPVVALRVQLVAPPNIKDGAPRVKVCSAAVIIIFVYTYYLK